MNRSGTAVLGVTANTLDLTAAGQITFVSFVTSTTNQSTPAALSSTRMYLYATTGGGATLYGYGTTNDVQLINKSQSTVLAIPTGTTGVKITGAFCCNGIATPQAAVASGGALAAYVTGAFGLDTNAHMQSLFNLVVSIRSALVANGIMS
jgi:hypothetical protein